MWRNEKDFLRLHPIKQYKSVLIILGFGNYKNRAILFTPLDDLKDVFKLKICKFAAHLA